MWQALRKYLITGLLTIIPLWITWLAVRFIFQITVKAGRPVATWLALTINPLFPNISSNILSPWVRDIVALLFVVAFLVFLGWMSARVMGRRMVALVEKLIVKIPLIKTIYGGSKKIIDSFQNPPAEASKVVLISYPSPEMKTVGLLTRTIIDKDSGQTLAAVYIPTTPNPTSGFLEIIPIEDVVMTDWSVNDAISFIVSGAMVGPDNVNFSKSIKGAENQ